MLFCRPQQGLPENRKKSLGRNRWVSAALICGVVIACMVGIYVLSSDARREINALATANGDSTQWSLAQTEVELLALLSEAQRTDLPEEEKLRNVRRRFDIYYSRVNTMRESQALAGLRTEQAAVDNLDAMSVFVDDLVPVIDGPDDALAAMLPDLVTRIEAVRPLARATSVLGIEHFAELSGEQRENVANALTRLGILVFLLVTALFVVVFALMRSMCRADRDAAEKLMTQRRMGVIVQTSLDAIVVVNLDGKVIEFNEAAEEVFGYTRDEIVGTKMSDSIVPPKYRPGHEAGMARYIRSKEANVVGKGRIQLEGMHKSGRIFPVEFSISSAEGPEGEIFVSYLRDISEQVAKEEELVRARDEAVAGERAKADLVAVMSHEMRTPLNGIVGALELLRSTDLDKTQSSMADVMGTSSDMLLQHVNDVLDMSRLEAGAEEKIQRPYDPVAVTHELLESLQVAAEKSKNKLELKVLDPQFDRVMGDATKLRQILTNLVGNAIKFTKHGKIDVEIERDADGSFWELRVSDEGVGISEEDQRRIFDDFVTLDPSYTRAQQGTGLGLGIVRRLVEHLDGEIGVESTLGEGTVFWVRLPTNLAMDSQTAPKTKSETHKADEQSEIADGMNILLVEDNAINRIVADAMLKKMGHTIIEAHNGVEGVEIASRRRFDVVLMDVSMPVMDGVEATKRIRAGAGPNADTPIFAVTAHAMPADIERFVAAGMNDVLVKPLSIARLNELLNGVTVDRPVQGDDLLDHELIGDLADAVGSEKHHALVGDFIAEVDDATGRFGPEDHHLQGDALRSEIHRLAGSASVIGAPALRDRLHHVESLLVAEELADATDALKDVTEIWSVTKDALRDLLDLDAVS